MAMLSGAARMDGWEPPRMLSGYAGSDAERLAADDLRETLRDAADTWRRAHDAWDRAEAVQRRTARIAVWCFAGSAWGAVISILVAIRLLWWTV